MTVRNKRQFASGIEAPAFRRLAFILLLILSIAVLIISITLEQWARIHTFSTEI